MTDIPSQKILPSDLKIIREAKSDMENLSWAIRNMNKLGNTLESGMNLLPPKVLEIVQSSTEKALITVVKANLLTIQKNKKFKNPSNLTYKAIAGTSGALGGFFGSMTGFGTAIFAAEIAVTTKFIMRSILDIARSEGEDIYSIEGQMSCLEVFALGGDSKEDDGIESSYYSTRVALSSTLKNVTSSSMKSALEALVKSAGAMGSNAVTKFISQIASRLSVILTEKFMAQAVPVVGAAGGLTLNIVFINHFQKMASAHFKIRRLERKYNEVIVKAAYDEIPLVK